MMNKQSITDRSYCDATTQLKQDIENKFLELGMRLKTIRDDELYMGVWESFVDYLDEEMGMSKSNASKLINIYEKFVQGYGIPTERLVAIGQDRLKEILPMVQDQASAVEWLDKAETLKGREYIRKEIAEAKTGINALECKHEDSYTLRICRICKDRFLDENVQGETGLQQ